MEPFSGDERRTYQSVGFDEDRRTTEDGDGIEKSTRVFCRDDGVDGLHDDNLFDQDEDGSGALIDPRNGEKIDNSTFTDEQIVINAGGYIIELDDKDKSVNSDYVDQWITANEKPLTNDTPDEIVA